MNKSAMSRRRFLGHSGAVAGAALSMSPMLEWLFALQPGEEIIPWADIRAENPVPQVIANQQMWEDLNTWITPNDKFFAIGHYNWPEISASDWTLDIGGLVLNPRSLTLDDIKALPRQEVTFTMECAGNSGLPFFDAGIGTAVWTGTPLAALLEAAGIADTGREIAFYGADAGEEILREQPVMQHFARSMSLEDAMRPDNLLVYEMNGEPLPAANGYPLRLIAPGWYGIANVKWLNRIDVLDSRLMNRFMARDYVTLRNEGTAENPDWTESSVGRTLLKSAPGRVVRTGDGYRIDGAAWGAPIGTVEVKIDDGPWEAAVLDASQQAPYAWTFWSLDWPSPTPGEHTITSRAVDTAGNVQPAQDDPIIANKITYWESNGLITRTVDIA